MTASQKDIPGFDIRPATSADLPLVASLFAACPEATSWTADALAAYPVLVAVPTAPSPPAISAAAVARVLAPGEAELLNVAVAPAWRRLGLAEQLIRRFFLFSPGDWFLEVRQSNAAAIQLYEKMGFSHIGRRPGYYADSGEDAIVMGFPAC